MDSSALDLAIVGGGLSGSLLAYRILQERPGISVRVFERGSTLGGNHTWSFHSSDVSPEILDWIGPLLSQSWKAQEVRFPAFSRVLATGYHSILSGDFHRKLVKILGDRVVLGIEALPLGNHSVALGDGKVVQARIVIDARGSLFSEPPRGWVGGFQKFLGWEVTLEQPHRLEKPLLMDATCEQLEGFRFFYVLPWTDDPRKLLIEDTRYSDSPAIDEAAFGSEIHAYAARRGWRIESIHRREKAALPIPFRRVEEAVPGSEASRIGYAGGFFQYTTGYSVGVAAEVAHRVAALKVFTPEAVREELASICRERGAATDFQLLLNRFLFVCARPKERLRLFSHFYGRDQRVIERFYAGRTSHLDRFRILWGRPPLPLTRAARVLLPAQPHPPEGSPQ